jgi:hypothetical protein
MREQSDPAQKWGEMNSTSTLGKKSIFSNEVSKIITDPRKSSPSLPHMINGIENLVHDTLTII